MGNEITRCGAASMTLPAGFLKRIETLDKPVIFLLSCALTAAIFGLDHLTGPLIPFGPYYFLPIGLAAWCLGVPAAAVFIILSSIARTFIFSHLVTEDHWRYYFWDMLSSVLIYSTVTFLLVRVKRANQALSQHSDRLAIEVREAERRMRLESSIRRAVSSDVAAIVELAVFGAEDGDLSKDVLNEVRQHALRITYADSIQNGSGARPTWAGESVVVPIEFWVSVINGRIAGFFMIMGIDQNNGAERELHAISVAREYRNLGVGTAMVDFFCSHFYGRRLYAACMPESKMRQMLKRRGFYHFADTNEGYVIVERVEWPKEKGLLRDHQPDAHQAAP